MTAYNQSTAGFSLIELMVSTAISALILIAASSAFMIIVMSNVRSQLRQQLNNEGRYALEQMRFGIRNATGLADGETCGARSSLAIENSDGSQTRYQRVVSGETQALHIVRKAADETDFPTTSAATSLTSDAVLATSLTFQCDEGTAGSKTILVSFTLSKTSTDTSISDTFSATVQMRN